MARLDTVKSPVARDADAERRLVTAMLSGADACAEASTVPPDAWTVAAYREIAGAALGLFGQGLNADAIAVVQALDEAGKLRAVGGSAAVMELWAEALTADRGYVQGLVDRVKRKWAQRRVLRVSQELARAASDLGGEYGARPVPEILGAVSHTIEKLQSEIDQAQDVTTAQEMVHALYDEMVRQREGHGTQAILTGLETLDSKLGGVRPGQLVFVASRPGMGKSVFALWWTVEAALLGSRCYYASLEMTLLEVASRVMSQLSLTPYAGMLSTEPYTEEQWGRIARHVDLFGDLPLVATEGPCTVNELRANIRRARRRLGGLDLVVVDQLEMIEAERDAPALPGDERERVVLGRTIDRLKQLAIQERIGVVVLHQLSRAVDARADHTPKLSDLAESSRAERRADKVVFLMRPSYYDEEQGGTAELQELDVVIAKHRMGVTGLLELSVNLETNRVLDVAMPDDAKTGNKAGDGRRPHRRSRGPRAEEDEEQ